MIWILPAALALLGVLVATPWILDRFRPPVSDDERAGAEGDFAGLTDGITHFRWYGTEGGPVHVLVHGLTADSRAFENLAGFLVLSGARVLVYDLYGRGLSDRPYRRQDAAFFRRQLAGLLADQKVEDGFTLVGASMGGAIATSFAEAEPDRVGRLVLIVPAGLSTNLSAFLKSCRKPVIGDLRMAIAGARHLRGRAALPDHQQELRRQDDIGKRGYLRSVLSSVRHMLGQRQDSEHAEIRRLGIPVLAIWGREDQTIPIRSMGELALANPEAHHAEIAEGGHGIARTHAREVAAAIRSFVEDARRAQALPINPARASSSR